MWEAVVALAPNRVIFSAQSFLPASRQPDTGVKERKGRATGPVPWGLLHLCCLRRHKASLSALQTLCHHLGHRYHFSKFSLPTWSGPGGSLATLQGLESLSRPSGGQGEKVPNISVQRIQGRGGLAH